MKKTLFNLAILIFSIIIINGCMQKNNIEEINSLIVSVKDKFAPDKRVAIFNISPVMDGELIKLTGETNNIVALNELVGKMEKLNLKYENNVNVLPDESLGTKIFGIINLSVANIRSEAKHPAELATQALLGTCVNVLKENNGWYLIQTPDKYIAWVDDDGVQLVDENELKNWKNSDKIIITKDYSAISKEPKVESPKISDVVLGDILKKVKVVGNYTKVEFPDGRIGFIQSNHTFAYDKWFNSAEANESTIVNTAYDFMGLPYLWGGTSLKGVDCSGFTKTVYFMNGVLLPRDASQQVHIGELVDTKDNFDNLKPGDLLFFGRKDSNTEKEKVTHVAIYIGDMQYIHSAGRVRINSFAKEAADFNNYRFNTFIRAKRVIGNYDKGENVIKNNSFYN